MLKLGRAQGAAIAAALNRSLPVLNMPEENKMSINGRSASKERVVSMLMHILRFSENR